MLGEHTDAILDEAGVAAADRSALRQSGVIS
jgi:crotonobetainyl-CoA:carnitine CoA-transferase CaiB-like acyl-CoA transferase